VISESVRVAKFHKRLERRDGCHIFIGKKDRFGYGKIKINYKYVSTHRYAWILKYGHIPDGMCVLHKCDQPACCNPDHLFLGTRADNQKDMASKKRSTIGAKNRHAVLSESDVVHIRTMYDGGHYSTAAIARLYGVHQTTIWYIVKRKTWKHVL
jgi:hypothetical protein